MTTNSQMPLRLNGPTRRFFCVWSDLNVRDPDDNMTLEWKNYWNDRWYWMDNGGAEACIYHLRYCVDVSQFNPATPPPVTEFLRDIREASKTPQQLTIESLIASKTGRFAADILTTNDILLSMKDSVLMDSDIASCDLRSLTTAKVGFAIKAVPGCTRRVGYDKHGKVGLWVVRNQSKYNSMTQGELYAAYMEQKAGVTAQPMMRVV